MAIKKTIEIDVNANAAEQDIKDLNKSVVKLDSSVEDLGKTGKKSLDNIDKNVKETEKSTKSLSEGFKGAGLALKAMGIGLVISLMNTLKEIFASNQKVADTFSAVLGTVATVFSQVTNVVVGVIEKVGGATKGFQGLQNVIGGLLKLSITPLKAAFFGIKLVIDEVRLAWEESFFGDNDPKTIKELTKRIEETQVSLKKVGTDAIESGKQVVNNIGKAINEVGQVVEGTIEGVSKISIEGAYAQAKANVQLQNTAKLAEAEQARLVEQYDRQAEKLRQIRDNENNSIEVRQKANDDLLNVLNKQEGAMKLQANAQLAAARATLAQNNNIDNQVAVTNALTNAQGVLAQVEGLRSEQDANKNALAKESKELTNSKLAAETELAINERNFNAERIKDEEKRLIAQTEALKQTQIDEEKRLQDVIDKSTKGTQARVDAENEFATRKQEIQQQIILSEDALAEFRLNKEKENREKAIQNQQKIIDDEATTFDAKRDALRLQEELLLSDKTLTEEQRTSVEKQYADARTKITQAEYEYKIAQAREAGQVLDNLGAIVGKQTAAGKALGIASALINTYVGASEALKQKSVLPSPFDYVAKAVNVAGILATGFKAVKAITAVNVPGGGGGGGASTSPITAPPAPSFNVVGNTGVNQLAQTLGTQQPVQAFVVANQVTSQQALDRNIINNASIG